VRVFMNCIMITFVSKKEEEETGGWENLRNE
jgi:hypothetical protein